MGLFKKQEWWRILVVTTCLEFLRHQGREMLFVFERSATIRALRPVVLADVLTALGAVTVLWHCNLHVDSRTERNLEAPCEVILATDGEHLRTGHRPLCHPPLSFTSCPPPSTARPPTSPRS